MPKSYNQIRASARLRLAEREPELLARLDQEGQFDRVLIAAMKRAIAANVVARELLPLVERGLVKPLERIVRSTERNVGRSTRLLDVA